jgi:hypothetical protein
LEAASQDTADQADSCGSVWGKRKMNFRITEHAREEMTRRSITLSLLEQVLNDPQQVVIEKGKLKAYQSTVSFEDGRPFLIRVIVDDTITPAAVVTVYRTSKIRKYWRSE